MRRVAAVRGSTALDLAPILILAQEIEGETGSAVTGRDQGSDRPDSTGRYNSERRMSHKHKHKDREKEKDRERTRNKMKRRERHRDKERPVERGALTARKVCFIFSAYCLLLLLDQAEGEERPRDERDANRREKEDFLSCYCITYGVSDFLR